MGEIQEMIGAARSSVSLWVRDVELTETQAGRLRERGNGGTREHLRRLSLQHAEQREIRWAAARAEAERQWPELSQNPWFMLGLGCYIGEGRKGGGEVCIFNSDMGVVKNFLSFANLLGVPSKRMKLSVQLAYTPTEEQRESVLEHWLRGLDIPPSQLVPKPVIVKKGAGPLREGEAKRSLRFGVCRLGCGDTLLQQKLLKWMELALGGV